MIRVRHVLWACAICTVSGAMAVQAATSGYWRYEEFAPGAFLPPGPDSVSDSSGNGYNMRTFDPTFTSPTGSASVSPLHLRSGLPNTRSLDFGPGGDDANQNDDIYSDGKAINGQLFNAMTVELAFRMNSIGGFQALVGKDGQPVAGSPIPPLKISVRGDDFPGAVTNQLFVEWFDGKGDDLFLASHQSVLPNTWYHVAFTLSPTEAVLWAAREDSPYAVLDSMPGNFAGPSGEVLINSSGNFTVGRGMYNGGVTDWSNALIDEVRISDTALSPNQFLFVTVPEPSSAALCALGVLGILGRRRK
jgi:hypothetical protein